MPFVSQVKMPAVGQSGIPKWVDDMVTSQASPMNVAFKNGDAQTFLQFVLGTNRILETEQTTDENKELIMKVHL